MVLFECVKEALQKSGLKARQVMTPADMQTAWQGALFVAQATDVGKQPAVQPPLLSLSLCASAHDRGGPVSV